MDPHCDKQLTQLVDECINCHDHDHKDTFNETHIVNLELREKLRCAEQELALANQVIHALSLEREHLQSELRTFRQD